MRYGFLPRLGSTCLERVESGCGGYELGLKDSDKGLHMKSLLQENAICIKVPLKEA